MMDEDIEYRIKRVQEGEIQQFHHIVEKFQHQIFIYCWRLLGNRQEAEDAVQDILVKAFERIQQYQQKVTFSSWLYKIAYHHCLNLLQRKKLQQRVLLGLFTSSKTADSAEKVLDQSLFSEPLGLVWRKLAPEERSLLVLRVFEEKSFGEIGDIMNKSLEAVKKKYSRLIAKLKTMMKDMEADESCLNHKTLSKTT